MKALITGITGFAGGHLAEHLLAAGDEVLGCSASGAWPPGAPDELRRRVPLWAWDLGDPAGLAAQTREQIEAFAPDCLYHLAAISVPEDCGQDEPTPRAMTINVGGTGRVVELAASLAGRPRVLFTSSSHVYAPVSAARFRLDEEAPFGPRRPYGMTKLAAEQVLLAAAREQGLDVVIARAFQHTGPRQSSRMMLPEWAAQLARRGSEPVLVYNRDTHLDITDVRDVARAYRQLVELGVAGATYNVGSGVSRRSGDILDLLMERAGSTREIVELNPGRNQDPVADNRRLVAQTGWRPEIPLERTVADTLDYWLRHEQQYV